MVILTSTDPRGWGSDLLSRFKKEYVGHPDESALADILSGKLPEDSNVDVNKVIAESSVEGRRPSPRDITSAVRDLVDYGMNPEKITEDLLISVLKIKPKTMEDISYENVVADLGDDTEVFRTIRQARKG